MSCQTIILLLSLCIVILAGIVLYQRLLFRAGIQRKLNNISGKLREINETDSDQRIMVFTDNKELIELAAQVNRLLEKHLKVKADYRRSQIASKRMLSNISHDIKTPMTVLLGYLEIMCMESSCSDEMLQKLQKKANDVMELIDRFFTLAKIESGDRDMELTKIDVCELCRESILDFHGLLTGSDFQVEINIPEAPICAQGNREALQRILCNLISNVIRYGVDGKYIGITLRTDEKTVYVDVTDKGKGIEKPFADSVFDRLFTMDDSRNRNIQGSGLGLTIAKNLALQLGGDLLLDSVPYVKTTFTVKLKKYPI